GNFVQALQAWNPFGTSEAEQATNSDEKRQELREQGLLDSFGERLFGDAHIGIGSADFRASGLGDLAFQFLDPLDIVGAGILGDVARISDTAARARIRRTAV